MRLGLNINNMGGGGEAGDIAKVKSLQLVKEYMESAERHSLKAAVAYSQVCAAASSYSNQNVNTFHRNKIN